MSSLAELRTQIDALDSELLRLIDARAALGQAIGEAKAKEEPAAGEVSLLRPDREAILLRKLLAKPRKAASDEVVVRIWRELISENLRIQGAAKGGLHLTLSTGEHSKEVLVWARERFGFAPAYGYVNDATAAIQAARKVRIIAALPELGLKQAGVRPHAVALAAIAPEPTGDDMTFWVSDAPDHENKIIEQLGQRGFAAEWLCTAQGLKLFGLIGYVQEHDERLATKSLGSLSGIIGAAPRISD